MTTRCLLIDGDPLVYRFAHANQKPIKWHRDLWTVHANEEPAKVLLDEFIEDLVEKLEASHYVVVLSDPGPSFRKTKIYPEYKQNRQGVMRPLLYEPLRQHLIDMHDAWWTEALEGDDLLGIEATYTGKQDCDEAVVCSSDKDLKCVPCKLYNWEKPELGVVSILDWQADWWHLLQTLAGDPVDGYPGCPKIGPVRAERILEAAEPGEEWEAVVAAYQKAGLGEEMALMNAQCARLLRYGEYDYETREVKLWTP